jgi:hypothetical protein
LEMTYNHSSSWFGPISLNSRIIIFLLFFTSGKIRIGYYKLL